MGWKVTLAPSVEPVTLAQAKAHLRVEHADEDAFIEALITVAREEAEQQLDRSISLQTIRLVLDAFPAGPIRLPRGPVVSVSAVRYYDADGVPRTVSSSDYALDDAQVEAWLLPAYGTTWPAARDQANAVEIDYVAGWSDTDCPASIVQWILLRVGTLYAYREADSDRPPMPGGFADRLLDRFRLHSL